MNVLIVISILFTTRPYNSLWHEGSAHKAQQMMLISYWSVTTAVEGSILLSTITHIISYLYNSSCDVVFWAGQSLDSRLWINRAEVISIVWVCVGSWERGTTPPALLSLVRTTVRVNPHLHNLWPLTSGLSRMTSIPPESTYDRICRRAFIINAVWYVRNLTYQESIHKTAILVFLRY